MLKKQKKEFCDFLISFEISKELFFSNSIRRPTFFMNQSESFLLNYGSFQNESKSAFSLVLEPIAYNLL